MIQYMQMKQGIQRCGKPFREWLLNLCGYEIWPPTHNDPRINGPQPRIITRRQREAMEKLRRADEDYAASRRKHERMEDVGQDIQQDQLDSAGRVHHL